MPRIGTRIRPAGGRVPEVSYLHAGVTTGFPTDNGGSKTFRFCIRSSTECPLLRGLRCMHVQRSQETKTALAPFLRPLSNHCAEHPAKVYLTVATPSDSVVCKVKSWLLQQCEEAAVSINF